MGQACLRRGRANTPEPRWPAGNPDQARQFPGQQLRLIELATPSPRAVQRYGDNQLNGPYSGRNRRHFRSQRLCQWPHSIVLKQVDKAAQVSFIRPEAARYVECRGRKPAKSTQMAATRREGRFKRQAAARAERLRLQWDERGQAFGANRSRCKPGKSPLAQAASVRKEDRKKRLDQAAERPDRKPPDARGNGTTTRED